MIGEERMSSNQGLNNTRIRRRFSLGFLPFVATAGLVMAAIPQSASGVGTPANDDSARCAALGNGQRIGNAAIVSATHIGEGTATDSSGTVYADLGSHCRVVAVASAGPESSILIEIWLPDAGAWNGKYLGTGNGAFAGSISVGPLAGGLRRGFAVANTDMGTFPAAQSGGAGQIGYAAGNGRPSAIADWGHRSTHEMTLLSKAVIEQFYGRAARNSYFAGCSTGGHQALMVAQRYPEDYDGILAGAAGHNRTHLHTMFLRQGLVMNRPDFTLPSLPSLRLWTDHWRASCVGRDGGAPGDAFLTVPSRCSATPRDLVCRAGQADGTCIPERDLLLLETMYTPTRNPRSGEVIYPRIEIGAEQSLVRNAHLMAAFKPRGVAAEIARWAFPPSWNAVTFDFDADMDRVDSALASVINANDPDLTRFAARGGKLIMWHGWEDYLVSPYDSITYYDRAFASGRSKPDFLQLFMAPGVDHCGGGAGPDSFGQMASSTSFQRSAGLASHDMLAALEAWVETARTPDTIVATKYDSTDANRILAERPLCPYPSYARYSGRGPISDARNFTCVTAAPLSFERVSPRYLN